MQVDVKNLELPKVSQAGMRILDVLGQEDFALQDVVAVASEDPTLSSMLIKYANSPLYRRYVEITSVQKAIQLLGIKNVKLVVTLAAMRSFTVKPSLAIDKLWEHSFGIAALSRLIGQKVNRSRADDFEFTGIIHDIATLTMAANFPAPYDALLQESCETQRTLCELEQERFSVSREQLLDWLAENLHLPLMSVCAIKLFNGLMAAPASEEINQQSQVLKLAHCLDRQFTEQQALRVLQDCAQDVPSLAAELGMGKGDLDEVIESYKEVLEEHFLL